MKNNIDPAIKNANYHIRVARKIIQRGKIFLETIPKDQQGLPENIARADQLNFSNRVTAGGIRRRAKRMLKPVKAVRSAVRILPKGFQGTVKKALGVLSRILYS